MNRSICFRIPLCRNKFSAPWRSRSAEFIPLRLWAD